MNQNIVVEQARDASRAPEHRGLPVFGSLFGFAKDPVQVVREGYERCGEVFSLRVANQRLLMVLAPEAIRAVLNADWSVLSSRDAAKHFIAIVGEAGFPPSHEEHQQMRQHITPIFAPALFSKYYGDIADEIHKAIIVLGGQSSVDIVGFSRTLAMDIVMRCFFGDEFGKELTAKVAHSFLDLIDGISLFLPPKLPLPRFIRRDRAKRVLHELIGARVSSRRAESNEAETTFARLCRLKHVDGSLWNIEETVQLIMTLILAGFEPTAALMSWGILDLLETPQHIERLRSEIDGASSNGDAALEKPRKAEFLGQCVLETTRLHGGLPLIVRAARKPFTVAGYRVPAGWLVGVCAPVTHRLPRLFSEPETYDPNRFGSSSSEDAGLRSSIIAFGGGRHGCLGRHFAELVTKATVASMFENFDMSLTKDPEINVRSISREPMAPCLLTLKKRK